VPSTICHTQPTTLEPGQVTGFTVQRSERTSHSTASDMCISASAHELMHAPDSSLSLPCFGCHVPFLSQCSHFLVARVDFGSFAVTNNDNDAIDIQT
jgi:hypothetical protein